MGNRLKMRDGLIVRKGFTVETGMTIITGSLTVTGSIEVSSLTGSLLGTASLATKAENASAIDIYTFGNDIDSYLLMSNVAGTSGVAIGGDADLRYNSSTNKLTVGTISATSLTGSLLGTASFATSASWAPSSPSFPYTGSAIISGSLNITGSGTNTVSIIGSGSSISSNSLLIRNGSGTNVFATRNDGKVVIGPNTGSSAAGKLTIFQNSANFFDGINFQTTANDGNVLGIGAISTSALRIGFNASYWTFSTTRLYNSTADSLINAGSYGSIVSGLYVGGIDIVGTYTNAGGGGGGVGIKPGGNAYNDNTIITINSGSISNPTAQWASFYAGRTINIADVNNTVSSIILNQTINQTQASSTGSIIGINHIPTLTSAYNYRAFDFNTVSTYTPAGAVSNYSWGRIIPNISASANNQIINGLEITLSGSNSSFTGVRRSALKLSTQSSTDNALTAFGNIIVTGSVTARQTGYNASGIFTGETIGGIALTTTASNGYTIFTLGGTLQIYDNINSATRFYSSGSNLGINKSSANSTLDINGNLTVTGSITATSTITMPNRPAFSVYGSGTTNNLTTSQNGDGTLNSNNYATDFVQGSGFDSATGIFTAPVAGLYQVDVVGRNSGYSAGISQLAVVKNNSNAAGNVLMVEWDANSSMNHVGGSKIYRLAVNDTLRLKVLAGEINFDFNDNWSVAYIG